jgi:hypothetical protein
MGYIIIGEAKDRETEERRGTVCTYRAHDLRNHETYRCMALAPTGLMIS